MSRFSLYSLPRVALALVVLSLAAPCVFAGQTARNDDSNPAKNLARMNCGATISLIAADGRIAPISSTDADGIPTALIMDDDTLSYPLQPGETTFVVTFPQTSLLDRFTFVNENAAAEGDLKIAVSNYRLPTQSSRWTVVNGGISFSAARHFNLAMLGVEARYVKLTFNVKKAGRIAALGLYGAQSLESFAARQRGIVQVSNKTATRTLEDMLNFNFANVYANARVVYVSSGPSASARRMIDDDTVTAFGFAPNDPNPTAIIELGDSQRLHRVSALYKMETGHLDIFLMEELGVNPGSLSGARPIASVNDVSGAGKAAVNFDPHGARYIALRWTPSQANASHGFEVAEISAFGDMPLAMLNTTESPDFYATSLTATTFPGLPSAPPVLPIVSP